VNTLPRIDAKIKNLPNHNPNLKPNPNPNQLLKSYFEETVRLHTKYYGPDYPMTLEDRFKIKLKVSFKVKEKVRGTGSNVYSKSTTNPNPNPNPKVILILSRVITEIERIEGHQRTSDSCCISCNIALV
jgi:hypothetical protein